MLRMNKMMLKFLFVLNIVALLYFWTVTSYSTKGDKISVNLKSNRASNRSFIIDYNSNQFLKDGQPFRFISGAIHYFRVHPQDWRDRMKKLRYSGCNTLETYVEWNSHEPEPDQYDFTGILNLEEYLSIAQEEGLLVILRPGPYICAERDMGGLPYWLLRINPQIELRTNDTTYMHYVTKWFNVLLSRIRPFLYTNGGPIIMVQVENEYGSYHTCDFEYTSALRDLMVAKLGPDVVLFTTDGDNATRFLRCGKIPNVYATVDFGSEQSASSSFKQMRLFEPAGPLVNSEYYPGWLDHWGEPHSTRETELIASKFDEMLSMGASVNIYLFHGGTNFGLGSGANFFSFYQADPTSYDYNAPLTEAGDLTKKYFAIRNVNKKYTTVVDGPLPRNSEKFAYGDCLLSPSGNVLDLLNSLKNVKNEFPLTFEQLEVFNGLVVYQTRIPHKIADPEILTLNDTHDRGYIFVDDEYAGMVSREKDLYQVGIHGRIDETISIIVESLGRIGFGSMLKDFKGLLSNVTLGNHTLKDWTMTPIPLLDVNKLQYSLGHLQQRSLGSRGKVASKYAEMSFYSGDFEVNHPADTFLRLDGWTKGYAYINNFLLGRYWPVVGPQVTLYIPRGLLKTGTNSILILELQRSPCSVPANCKVTLTDTPDINDSTPQFEKNKE